MGKELPSFAQETREDAGCGCELTWKVNAKRSCGLRLVIKNMVELVAIEPTT
jgi:hypothetical protein